MSTRKLGIGSSMVVLWVALLGVLALPALAARPPFHIQEEGVAMVESATEPATAATFQAEIWPWVFEEIPGLYYFEYAENEAFTQGEGSTASQAIPMPDEFGVHVSIETAPAFKAGKIYYFRIVVESAQTILEGAPVVGAVQAFMRVPVANTDLTTGVTATSATFHGHLTQNAFASEYHFVYRPGAQCTGEGQGSTQAVSVGAGSEAKAASTTATGLISNTQYSVCFVTSNVSGSETGSPVTFTTPPAAPAVTESAIEVAAKDAKLGAEIDPGGAETTYHFEYDTTPYTSSAHHGTSTPEASLTADNSEHPVSAPIQELTPGTEYHYRVVATNAVEAVYGPDRTFTTQSVGGPLVLPDHRQYELVSPAEKDAGQVFGLLSSDSELLSGTGAVQASEDGNGMTYLMSAPGETGPAGNAAPVGTQVLSSRAGDGGWASKDISPAYPGVPGAVNHLGIGEDYRLFSPDLSGAVLQELVYSGIELRDNGTGVSQALDTGGLPLPTSFVGATPDLTHILFQTNEQGNQQEVGLYEWSSGDLAQVNILEHGEVATIGYFGSYGEGSHFAGRHAFSSDGSRVVWGTEGALYTRDMVTKETVQVDANQGGSNSGGGVFQLASSDGTRVFFTDGGELTLGAAGTSLYMFNVLAKPGERLTDLGLVGISTPEFPEKNGVDVLGANEAATVVYVTSQSVLTKAPNPQGEKAVANSGNIFVWHEAPVGSGSWSVSFIATLSGSDEGGYRTEPGKFPLATLPVRVSPNGEFFAFMSDRSLTGYDNLDAINGQADEEVFLYGAQAQTLVCASCDPSGARPVGESGTPPGVDAYPALPIDPTRTWGLKTYGINPQSHWLAAAIPGWSEAAGGNGASLYESRLLSDSGRLFFDSRDALVPQDVNGRDDVYQYEPAGSAAGAPPNDTCGTESSTYSPRSAGCVSLISSGQGGGDSEFVDASANGNDVFFTTAAGLVPGDTDGVVDMYDASVCDTAETHPCPPSSTVASPACDSSDSCRAAPSAQPGMFGAPPSATFSGAGNVTPAPTPAVKAKAKPAKCRKGLVKKQNRCVKEKKSKKAKRAGNKRRAK